MRHLVSLLLACYLLLPFAARAQEKIRDPLSIPLKTYVFMLGIALLGGIASWYAKVRKGEIPGYSAFHLIGELATSALAGLMCFWICEWMGLSQLITAPLTGLAGHMGAKAITMFEQWAAERAKKAGAP